MSQITSFTRSLHPTHEANVVALQKKGFILSNHRSIFAIQRQRTIAVYLYYKYDQHIIIAPGTGDPISIGGTENRKPSTSYTTLVAGKQPFNRADFLFLYCMHFFAVKSYTFYFKWKTSDLKCFLFHLFLFLLMQHAHHLGYLSIKSIFFFS
jgi:hypothetical protein